MQLPSLERAFNFLSRKIPRGCYALENLHQHRDGRPGKYPRSDFLQPTYLGVGDFDSLLPLSTSRFVYLAGLAKSRGQSEHL